VGAVELVALHGLQHWRHDLYHVALSAVFALVSVATKGGRLSRTTRSLPHVLAGAFAFAAAQAVLFLVAGDTRRPTVDSPGWFLNSGRGVLVMAVVAAAVCGAALRAWPAGPIWKGWVAFVGGAAVALVISVFVLGPGTIFPIVIAAGVAVVGVGALAGSAAARPELLRRRTR